MPRNASSASAFSFSLCASSYGFFFLRRPSSSSFFFFVLFRKIVPLIPPMIRVSDYSAHVAHAGIRVWTTAHLIDAAIKVPSIIAPLLQ